MLIAHPDDYRYLPALSAIRLNTQFVRAVLEGEVTGRVWVDQLPEPRVAHAMHPYGMSFIWGECDDERIPSLADHVLLGAYRKHDEWLQIAPSMSHLPWNELLNAVPGNDGQAPGGQRVQRYERVNFQFEPERFFARNPEAPPLPAGWRLRPMTADEFDLPDVSVSPRAFWHNATQFLARGGGWCADINGEIGTIVFTSFRTHGSLEIGVETRGEHRGKGLAHAAAATFLKELVDKKVQPVWSCRRENVASYELAIRLGFTPVRTVPYFRLPASSASAAPASWSMIA